MLKKLKAKVGSKLKGNGICYYLYKCLKNVRDKDFRDIVTGYQNADIIHIRHLGKKYPNEFVYCVKNRGNAGFWSEMTVTLQCLQFAEIFQLTPVICWDEDGLYVEKESFKGIRNSFEYFFEPVSHVAYADILKCRNLIFSVPDHRLNTCVSSSKNEYEENFSNTEELGRLYQKFCKLNSVTKDYINKNLQKTIAGKRTLGVHVRGTDFKKVWNNHPVYISAGHFITPTKELLQKHKYEQVFLATDSLEALELFRSEFGDKLVFYEDVMRSDGSVGVHCAENDRKNHRYLLGLEVLRDAYTLAACDALLAGMSNVSLAAQYIKISNGSKHEEIVILNQGINYTI